MTEPAHQPFVPAEKKIPEFKAAPIIVGTVLGIVFGSASLYLALRIGMTISASIPIAVMSISIFRWFSKAFGARQATILENNLVQTVGSAGESIAFGVAVTMPALLILGTDIDLIRTMTVSVLGSALGILMMIPLRRGLIVKEHGTLAYPEGTACAEVLIAGEKGGTSAKTVFTGFAVGAFFKALAGEGGLQILKNTPGRLLGWFKGGSIHMEAAPELMGVGYIIGPRTSGIMVAGSVLSYLVLIPAIKIFGEGLAAPLFPATKLIRDMSPGEMRNAYVLYIGAGAVAAAGIISLIKVLPTIVSAFVAGFQDLLGGRKAKGTVAKRTDRDLSMAFVALGSLALVVALSVIPAMHLSILASVLILVFGFLFVTVSSRLVGEIGSSSNPISGMTVATLLLTCLIFLTLGWTSPAERISALMIAAVVCVAAANAGASSQDLKTGFLVGATPRAQQIGILIGAMASAAFIGVMLKVFNDKATIFAKRTVPGYTVSANLFQKEDGKPVKLPLHGPDAAYDSGQFNVVHFTGETAPKNSEGQYVVEPGKYLVDDDGAIRYLVDPGVNGVLNRRDARPGETQGQAVAKYDAPKARLMSLIIDGILSRKLPWGLVLLGIFITLMLELAGINALAFAVGVYLTLGTTAPIGVGGLIRHLVDRKGKKSNAESDTSPGVLMSSGLIAGGAVAGMLLAILVGSSEHLAKTVELGHRFPRIAESDLISLVAFGLLGYYVFGVGRGKFLKS